MAQQSFFNPTTPQPWAADTGSEKNKQAEAAALMTEQFLVPSPSFTFRASASAPGDQWRLDCFPLAGSEVICADQLGHTFRFDAESGHAWTMPGLHKPKSKPLSLFVPNVDADNDFEYGHDPEGSSLFVTEKILKPEVGCSTPHSDQFEFFVYRKTRPDAYIKAWHCELLPPPPYVREPMYQDSCLEISSYAVIDSDICISVKGVGTYRLHTASRTWKEVGEWTLPFHGRVEYVPELKLWFGLSAESQHLAAADIASLDSQPQLLGPWKELELPEEWKECKDSQLVNLGYGKFCIARFFHPRTLNDKLGNELSDQNFTVLTGVEVAPLVQDSCVNVDSSSSNEIMELRMIPHKSRYHTSSGTSIDAVF
ncbi:unnamed protein product [Urochloa humidicola]